MIEPEPQPPLRLRDRVHRQQFLVALAGMELLSSVTEGTPIVYLHADHDAPPLGVLLSARAFADLLELVPEGDEITQLVMAHTHVTG